MPRVSLREIFLAAAVLLLGAGTLAAAPFVDRVHPFHGSTSGGDTITIYGLGFEATSTVSLAGVSPSSVTFISSEELEVVTNSSSAGIGDVVVTNADFSSSTLQDGFWYANYADVVTTTEGGAGSLGEAISRANSGACAQPCVIRFLLSPAPGYRFFELSADLPAITASRLAIDGTTQTDLVGDTNPSGPEVQIEQGVSSTATNGLSISGNDVFIKGIAIIEFPTAIVVSGDRFTIQECFVGREAEGTPVGGGLGLDVSGADVLIGGVRSQDANYIEGFSTAIRLTDVTGGEVYRNIFDYCTDGVSVTGTSSGVTIGDTSGGENIFTQLQKAVIVKDSATATIRGNIFNPDLISQMAIDLADDGPTANDVDDTDSGPNGLQNYPTIQGVSYDSENDQSTIQVVFATSTSNAGSIDIYWSSTEPAALSGSGSFLAEAGYAAGTTIVSKLVAGDWRGVFLSAAATSVTGTSELSPAECGTATPDATISISEPVCALSSGNVASAPMTSGATYTWTITNGTIDSGQSTNQILFTAGSAGSVDLELEVVLECAVGTDQASAVIHGAPAPAINTASAVCEGASGHVASTALVSGASYSWSITNGTIDSGQGSPSMTWSPTGLADVEISVVVATVCGTGGDTVFVSVDEQISAGSIITESSVCPNSSSHVASAPLVSGASYNWSITNGTLDSGQGTNKIFYTAGAFGSVGLSVAISNACGADSANTSVLIDDAPDASITAPTLVCTGVSGYTASAPLISGAAYSWSITNGTILSGQGTSTISFAAGSPGSMQIDLSVSNACGVDQDTVVIQVDSYANATLSAPETVCANTGGHVASAPLLSGATYEWSITNGSITSGQGTSSIVFSSGGSGVVTIGLSVTTGCSFDSSSAEIPIEPQPDATIFANGGVCEFTGGHVASAPLQAGVSYSWSITNGTITSGQGTSQITYSAGAPGALELSLSVSNGCGVDTGSVSVEVADTAVAQINAPATVCPGSTGNVASSPLLSGASYNWSISNGTLTSGQGTSQITFTAGPSGEVALALTVVTSTFPGASACSADSDEAAVTIAPSPVASISTTSFACPGTSGYVASTPLIAGATYSWSITNGSIVSGQGTDTITYSAGSPGSLSLQVTVSTSCGSDTDSVVVTVGSNADASITAPETVCANAGGHVASAPLLSGASYSWTVTNGTITGGQGTNAITFTAGSSGDVTIALDVITSCGADSGSVMIPIEPGPTASIVADAVVCESGSGYSASTAAVEGASYTWTISNGTIDSGQGTDSISYSPGSAGSLTLGVSVTTSCGVATDSATVSVEGSPDATITTPASGCPNQELTASVPAQSGASYLWSVTNGSIVSGQGTSQITYLTGTSGSTGVSVQVETVCGVVGSGLNVQVNPAPVAAITTVAEVCPGTPGHAASTQFHPSWTYAWAISGGTITSGQGTSSIVYSAGSGTTVQISVVVSGCGTASDGVNVAISQTSIAPSSASFTASGGSGSFSVNAGSGCSRIAASNDSWITITAGGSGSGSGTISYSVAPNPAGARTGTISVNGQTFTVSQSAFTGVAQILGDFNADGFHDVLWRNPATGENAIWFMNGTTVAAGFFLPTVPTSLHVAGIGDANGDGRSDIFWRNSSTGETALWLMNGYTVTAGYFLPTITGGLEIRAVGDVNGDGRADVIWRDNTTGENAVWLMNGPTIIAGAFLPTVTGELEIQALGDLNGDGRSDVIWRNSSTGENAAWLMNGTSVSAGAFLPTVSGGLRIRGASDLNRDGRSDIIWRDNSTSTSAVWLMNGLSVGSGHFLPVVAAPLDIRGLGDLDGDGDGDIFWRNQTTGETAVWLMSGPNVTSGAFLPTVPNLEIATSPY